MVGTINLVEKIAAAGADSHGRSRRSLERRSRTSFAIEALPKAVWQAADGGSARRRRRQPPASPRKIIKEGLSEYFIFTIEGTETIPNGWSKRMRASKRKTSPLKIQYRYRPQEYGDQLVRMYLLTNDKESKLGTTPLPDGVVRVFRDNGRDGLSYLTSQTIKYIPDRRQDRTEPGRRSGGDLRTDQAESRRATTSGCRSTAPTSSAAWTMEPAQIEVELTVAGWDEHQIFAQRIRNYTAKPIDVEIRRSFDGHVVFRSELKPMLHDYRTVQFTASVDAGKRRICCSRSSAIRAATPSRTT